MKCLHPVTIRHPGYLKWFDDFWSINGRSPSDQEITKYCDLYHIERLGGKPVLTIPCGRCLYCFQRKQSDWKVRLQAEQKSSMVSYFVTLTYDEENNPYNVDKKAFQKFMKRFRINLAIPCRYFAISEYGPLGTRRPHYHFCLFFKQYIGFEDLLLELEKSWTFGNVHVGDLTDGRIDYLSTYCIKFFNEPPEGCKPNFMCCSRRPGIGSDYLSKSIISYHRNSMRNFMSVNGFKKHLPRYYREKIFDDAMKLQLSEVNYEHRKVSEEKENEVKRNFADEGCYIQAQKHQAELDYKRAWTRFKESKQI